MAVSPARRAAFEVLLRVEGSGGYSDELLHGPALDRLDDRDRGLASEIVLGCLRRQGVIDDLIERAAGRPAAKLDFEVLLALRIGAYQMRWLDRVPDRAAVSESVELIKRGPKRSASGLVNAVLRKLPERPDAAREIELSAPRWMLERWRRRYGLEPAAAIAAASGERPATYLRLNVRRPLDETVARLEAEGVRTEATETPSARLLLEGRPERTACWREGLVRIQDLSSQLIVPLLDLQPGCWFLDVCAAPGGKTQQAVEVLGGRAGIVAGDLRLHRLRAMRELAAESVDLVQFDAACPAPFSRRFDRVLVDAPCSGTGTLARNPEIRWRLRPADLADLQARQVAILGRALEAAAPGGVVVYSTCSLEPEENGDVVAAALSRHSGWRIADTLERLPGRDAGDGFFAFKLQFSDAVV